MAQYKREKVAVIGGGLGGCLSALLLARHGYKVTLIESQPILLNGASRVAARLHLGGEYPMDIATARECVQAAIVWKLLMPKDIYTDVAPMKFTIARKTDALGQKGQKKGLRLEDYEAHYELVRQEYETEFKRVQQQMHWSDEQTAKALFGSYQPGEFFRRLEPHEYAHLDKPKGKIAGGFQTHELGLNPKYLVMIEKEIVRQQRLGNIEILAGHTVSEPVQGELGNFSIFCENRRGERIKVAASQVVGAAWQNNPSIIPLPPEKQVTVYHRAIMTYDLPPGTVLPPGFVMKDEYGGMLSAYNDHTLIAYLPGKQTSYLKQEKLTAKAPRLPANWQVWPEERRAQWEQQYDRLLRKQFPVLDEMGAKHPHMIDANTLSFQTELGQRRQESVTEAITTNIPAVGMGLAATNAQHLEQSYQMMPVESPVFEVQEGLFANYPTKATYAMSNAFKTLYMVTERSKQAGTLLTAPKDVLHFVLPDYDQLRIGDLPEPDARDYARFLRTHPDINVHMFDLPAAKVMDIQQRIKTGKWAGRVDKGGQNTGFSPSP